MFCLAFLQKLGWGEEILHAWMDLNCPWKCHKKIPLINNGNFVSLLLRLGYFCYIWNWTWKWTMSDCTTQALNKSRLKKYLFGTLMFKALLALYEHNKLGLRQLKLCANKQGFAPSADLNSNCVFIYNIYANGLK